jgi:putative transposase
VFILRKSLTDLGIIFGGHVNFGKAFTTVSTAGVSGVRDCVFKALCKDPDFEYVMIDSTLVRAHKLAAGAEGGVKTSFA